MEKLTVAIVQSDIVWENKSANFKHIEENFFNKLIGQKTNLVLLPEMFQTGFSMNVNELSEQGEGETILWMKKWANQLNTLIGGTLMIEQEGHVYNRFVIVSKNRIEISYNKRHLFRMAGENEYFSAGDSRIIFHLNGWNILLQICYDLRFPVYSRNRVFDNKKEYDAAIYLASWPIARSEAWKTLLKARAIENQAYCIGVNRVGKDEKGNEYSGDSAVIDPWGNYELSFEPKEELQIVELQKSKLREIHQKLPFFLDADSFEII